MNAEQVSTIWQKAVPDISWGSVILFCSIVVGYLVVAASIVTGLISLPVASMVCTWLCYASFTVVHDAGHGNIFRMGSKYKPVETMMGWVASIPLLLTPYRLFQKIHDRHHAYTNDPERDPDHFVWDKSWLGILLNIYYIPFQYYVMVFTRYRKLPDFRSTFASSFLYLLMVWGVLLVLAINGLGEYVFWLAILPMLSTLFLLIMFFDYIPHHPHKSLDEFQNTRIYPGVVMNALLLGQNYHLIHHLYPRLPWYRYQSVFKQIESYLLEQQAPIEYLMGRQGPGLLKSANSSGISQNGAAINARLLVSAKQKLTEDAAALIFQLRTEGHLKFVPGQYITVSKWLNGDYHTRCYSLCSLPEENTLCIGVKRVPGGVMSEYLVDNLAIGDELVVKGPFGNFRYHNEDVELADTLFLVAGGSGITPILSILRSALNIKRQKVALLYCCRNKQEIMFYKQLQALALNYSNRFTIHYWLSQDNETSSRLSRQAFTGVLAQHFEEQEFRYNVQYYLCGPEGLLSVCMAAFEALKVKENHIHIETFASTLTRPLGQLHNIVVNNQDGSKLQFQAAENQTLLEAAKSAKVSLPHACGNGTCGSCKVKITNGEIETRQPGSGITQEEMTAGYGLACQIMPRSVMELQY